MTDQPDPNQKFRKEVRYTSEAQPTPRIILIPIGLLITLIIVVVRLLGGTPAKTTYSESNAHLLNSGVSYYNDGDYDKAILYFNMVIASQPDFGEAYNNLGLAYQARGENSQAIAEFDKAIQLMPNPATPYSNRGGLYLSMGDQLQAIADIDKAIELDPSLAKAFYNRGLANLDLGKYEAAIVDFSKAIELTPEQLALMQVMMQTRMPQGESPLTTGLMKDLASTQKYADLPTAYAYRGVAYAQLGDTDHAVADLQKASELGLDPGSALQIEALLSAPPFESQPEEWGVAPGEPASQGYGDAAPWDDVWVSYGLEGQRVNAIVIDPVSSSTLYAGTDSGLFKSTDAGSSWSLTGLSAEVNSLAIDPARPAVLYAGTGAGLFKSTDDGENWRSVGLDSIHTLAIDPLSPSTLYAGTYHGVFKSTNAGEDWGVVNAGLDNSPPGMNIIPVVALAVDPQMQGTIYAGTMTFTYPGTSRSAMCSVFKSTNEGQAWNRLFDGGYTSFTTLGIDPRNPDVLYVGSGTGVYKSTDGGQTWSAANKGLSCTTVYALAIDPSMPSALYLGSFCGLFKSMDGGQSWTGLDPAYTYGVDVYSLAIDPHTSTRLYAGTGAGLVVIHQENIR